MKKLAVLGPAGTYCDVAAKSLNQIVSEPYQITYFQSILKTALAISDDIDGLLPFENTLDGFVVETMDAMIQRGFTIVQQVKLPIDFIFISKAKSLDHIQNLYVQFKAHGQCLQFIGLHSFQIHVTQSNIESLEELKKSDDTYAAIVPAHVDVEQFPLVLRGIADSVHNETRFVHISKKKVVPESLDHYLSAMAIGSLEDRPGILYDILKRFNDYHINLKSIFSRPRKDKMGKYIFYLEFEIEKKDLYKIEAIQNDFKKEKDTWVHSLGIYNVL